MAEVIDIEALPPPLEVHSRRAHYAYPDLEFLRDAGRSIVSGWRTREEFTDTLPTAVVNRLIDLVRRHVDAAFGVSVSAKNWTVKFTTKSPRGSEFLYGFDVRD